MRPKYTASDYQEIKDLHPYLSNYAIASMFGVNESTVRRAIKKLPDRLEPNKKAMESVDVPIDIDSNHIAVTADWHIPLCDYEYANRFIDQCYKLRIRELVLAGDVLNADWYSTFYPKQEDADPVREREESLETMFLLASLFDRIYYTWGNHDYRYVKHGNYKQPFDVVMAEHFAPVIEENPGVIQFSNLDHMYVNADSGRYYICHPRSYSSVPLSSAIRMATKYPNTHVLTAHSHHCAFGYARDGKSIVAELGGMFDANKTAYLQRSTTFPHWQNGFGLIVDGQFQLHGRSGKVYG